MEENLTKRKDYEFELIHGTPERQRAIILWFYESKRGIVITEEVAGELIKDLIVFCETR